jgi:hypothetical protein
MIINKIFFILLLNFDQAYISVLQNLHIHLASLTYQGYGMLLFQY